MLLQTKISQQQQDFLLLAATIWHSQLDSTNES